MTTAEQMDLARELRAYHEAGSVILAHHLDVPLTHAWVTVGRTWWGGQKVRSGIHIVGEMDHDTGMLIAMAGISGEAWGRVAIGGIGVNDAHHRSRKANRRLVRDLMSALRENDGSWVDYQEQAYSLLDERAAELTAVAAALIAQQDLDAHTLSRII